MQGQRCARMDCQCRLHDICTQQIFRRQDSRKCPLCKTDWTSNDFVGERAAARMKEKPKKRRSGLSNGSSFARHDSSTGLQDDRESSKEPSVADSED